MKDPRKLNYLTIEDLIKSKCSGSSTFDPANRDLYEYMKKLEALGVQVVVVSGEQTVDQIQGK